jgi:hypothetical protein
MAIIRPVDGQELEKWIATRPPAIQEMVRSHPPERLYRMKSTGSRVEIHSYAEDGTVTVWVGGQWNLVLFGRHVFGVPLDDLEECDLPPPSEMVGAIPWQ